MIRENKNSSLTNTLINIDDIVTNSLVLTINEPMGTLKTDKEVKPPDSVFTKVSYVMEPDESGNLLIHALHGEYNPRYISDIAAFYKLDPNTAETISYDTFSQIMHSKTTKQGTVKRHRISRLHQYLPLLTDDLRELFCAFNKIILATIKSQYKAVIIIDHKNKVWLKELYLQSPEIIVAMPKATAVKTVSDTLSYKGKVFGQIYILNKSSMHNIIPQDRIVYVKESVPHLTQKLQKVKGIVLETPEVSVKDLVTKGIHKPIVKVKKGEHSLRNGDLISLDSATGKITKVNKDLKQLQKIVISDLSEKNKLKRIMALNAFEPKDESFIHGMLIDNLDDSHVVLQKIGNSTLYIELSVVEAQIQSQFKKVKELLTEHKVHRVVCIFTDVTIPDQIKKMKEDMHKAGISRSVRLHLFLAVTNPANSLLLQECIDEGIDGVVFDWQRMTRTMYGFDKATHHETFKELMKSSLLIRLVDMTLGITQRRDIPLYLKGPSEIDEQDINGLIQKGIRGIIIEAKEYRNDAHSGTIWRSAGL